MRRRAPIERSALLIGCFRAGVGPTPKCYCNSHRPSIEVQSRSWTTRDHVDLNPSQTATLETEICGQRLWARRAEKSFLNAPNRLQRRVLRAPGYGNVALFLTLGNHVGLHL